VIEEAPATGPSVRRSETRLTLPKGQTAKLGAGGQEVTLEAEILDFSK